MTNKYEQQDFVMWNRDFMKDLEEGALTFEEYGLLAYLFQRANPVNGNYTGNVTTIGESIGLNSKAGRKKVSYLMNRLKEKGYIWFDTKQGTRRNYHLEIGHYPCARTGFRNIRNMVGDDLKVKDEFSKSDSPSNEHEDIDDDLKVPNNDNKYNNINNKINNRNNENKNNNNLKELEQKIESIEKKQSEKYI